MSSASPFRAAWADESSCSDDGSVRSLSTDDNTKVNCQNVDCGLLVFYNTKVDASSFLEMLGTGQWAKTVYESEVLDMISVGIPTQATVKSSDNLADVLSLTFCVVRPSAALDRNTIFFKKPNREKFNGLSESIAGYTRVDCNSDIWAGITMPRSIALQTS